MELFLKGNILLFPEIQSLLSLISQGGIVSECLPGCWIRKRGNGGERGEGGGITCANGSLEGRVGCALAH